MEPMKPLHVHASFDEVDPELAGDRIPWTKWTDGELAFEDLSPEDQKRARAFLANTPATQPNSAESPEFLDVSPDKDWGDDGEGPEEDQAVWDWLVVADDAEWPAAERIEYAKTVGRYDIVEAIESLEAGDGRSRGTVL